MKKRIKINVLNDSGYTMVVAIGILILATVISIAVITRADNLTTTSTRIEQESRAFQIAMAGLDAAMANMRTNTYVAVHYPMSGNIDNGNFRVTVEPLGNNEFKVTSIGTTSAGATSTVVERFFYLNIWGMNVAGGTSQSLVSGSSGLRGNTSIHGGLYIRGSVEFPANSIMGAGPVFVRDGNISISGSGLVGTEAQPIDIHVTGSHPPMGTRGWFPRRISRSVPLITMPTLTTADMARKLQSAREESVDNIQGTPVNSTIPSSEAINRNPATYTSIMPPNTGTWSRQRAPGSTTHYKVVDGNLTIDDAQRSWGSWFGDGRTLTMGRHDDFAFDTTTNTLYVAGTVYINGDLTIQGNIRYVGNGTMVVAGTISIAGQFLPATGNMVASHALGLVTPNTVNLSSHGGTVTNPDDNTPPDIAVAIFTNDILNINTKMVIRGSVIAGIISFNAHNAHLMTNPLIPTFLPPNMPGGDIGILTSSSWARK